MRPSHVPPHLHASLAYRVTHAQRVLRRGFLALMRANDLGDLSPEQWWMLAQVAHQPGCTQVDLSDELFGDRPNVTRMLDRLEAAGLITRAADAEDARKRRVWLTDAGSLLTERVMRAVEQERARLYKGLDPDDVAATLRVLDALEQIHR